MNVQHTPQDQDTQNAAAGETKAQPPVAIEGDDFDLPVCGLNPNDPAFAGCDACQ